MRAASTHCWTALSWSCPPLDGCFPCFCSLCPSSPALGTVLDADLGVLVDHSAVLGGERGRHHKVLSAETSVSAGRKVRTEGRVGALRKIQVERTERNVGDLLER